MVPHPIRRAKRILNIWCKLTDNFLPGQIFSFDEARKVAVNGSEGWVLRGSTQWTEDKVREALDYVIEEGAGYLIRLGSGKYRLATNWELHP